MSSSLEKRLEVIQTEDGDPTCITFVLKEEDHTLGNALRYVINQNPDVDFCGYAIPHPSEKKVNLRIQTKGVPAADVFKKGLEDLLKICDHVTETFKEARQAYDERREEEINEKLEAMHTD